MVATEDQVIAPVLEPLCNATDRVLTKIHPGQDDFLLLDLDHSGENFVAESASLRLAGPDDDEVDWITGDGRNLVRNGPASTYDARGGWVRSIPEVKQLTGGRLQLAATDFTCLIIRHGWPADKVLFISESAEVTFKYILARFFSQDKNALRTARFKLENKVDPLPGDFLPHPDPDKKLELHQQLALLNCLDDEGYALFMEQGIGKTYPVIARVNLEGMRKRRDKGKMYRVLVICPKQVRYNWELEFERFSVYPGKVTSLRGSLTRRMRNLVDGVRNEDDLTFAAVMLPYDSVEATMKALARVPWNLVVLDESHMTKNPKSKRWSALRYLRDLPFVGSRMILTGTPIANHPFDLWTQLEFLGQGESGFRSYENFRRYYGKFKKLEVKPGQSVEKLVGIKNKALLQERLARKSLILRKSDANLHLPDKMYDVWEVEMTATQTEWYAKVAEAIAIELESADPKKMTTDHILTKLLRLAQITSGHVKWDEDVDPTTFKRTDPGVEQIPGGNPKIDAIREIVRDAHENSKKVIWCSFREDIRAVMEALKCDGVDCVSFFGSTSDKMRLEAVERFNCDPAMRVMVANAKTAGAGLNLLGYDYMNSPPELTTNCDHMIIMSQTWSATERSQLEDRGHRRGTRASLQITDLVVPGTIDQDIRMRVMGKQALALEIQNVREVLERILGREVQYG